MISLTGIPTISRRMRWDRGRDRCPMYLGYYQVSPVLGDDNIQLAASTVCNSLCNTDNTFSSASLSTNEYQISRKNPISISLLHFFSSVSLYPRFSTSLFSLRFCPCPEKKLYRRIRKERQRVKGTHMASILGGYPTKRSDDHLETQDLVLALNPPLHTSSPN